MQWCETGLHVQLSTKSVSWTAWGTMDNEIWTSTCGDTLSLQDINATVLILNMPPEQPKFIGGVEGVPQGCWPILTPILPTVVSSWLDVLWVVDHSWYTQKLLRMKNPAALQFLTQTGAHGTYYNTPFKGTKIFCLAYSPSEWHTYTLHVYIISRLKNHSLTCLLPFNLHWLKWI
jgi:hypothetical protein